MAHRPLYHSTLGSRIISQKRRMDGGAGFIFVAHAPGPRGQGIGFRVRV